MISSLSAPSPSRRRRPHRDPSNASSATTRLEPTRIADHIDALYRAACVLCRSRQDAEDLVQETFTRVLSRPRFIRRDRELGYLLRALRNTHYSRLRAAARGPVTVSLDEDRLGATVECHGGAREIMQAIASAPAPFRDAVIAVDLVGLPYEQAAKALRTRTATLTTRLHRGRQHVARALTETDSPR